MELQLLASATPDVKGSKSLKKREKERLFVDRPRVTKRKTFFEETFDGGPLVLQSPDSVTNNSKERKRKSRKKSASEQK